MNSHTQIEIKSEKSGRLFEANMLRSLTFHFELDFARRASCCNVLFSHKRVVNTDFQKTEIGRLMYLQKRRGFLGRFRGQSSLPMAHIKVSPRQ